MYLCFPSNPHGALANINYLVKAVNLAKKYNGAYWKDGKIIFK